MTGFQYSGYWISGFLGSENNYIRTVHVCTCTIHSRSGLDLLTLIVKALFGRIRVTIIREARNSEPRLVLET